MVELDTSLVSTEWLQHNLGAPGLVVVDIRGYVKSQDVGGGQQIAEYVGAQDEYLAEHIPGSVYIDWTVDIVDLDDPVKAQIAQPDVFKEAMESRGISDDTAVVAVDHAGGHFATRLWWALRYYGHTNVAVLDGGYYKWGREARPTTRIVPSPAPGTFTPNRQPDLRSDWADVREAITSTDATIVDARDAKTFTGEVWRGARPGHIASAINLPAANLFEADGTWKSDEQLREIVAASGIDPDRETVAYCNGGVTATSVLFALDRIGITNTSNYDGSWNEWSEREDLPVETGD